MIDYWPLSPFISGAEPEPILRDVFNGWQIGDGIFNALQNLTDQLPWAEVTTVDNSVLDIAYFGNRSGGKFCSPLVKLVLDDDGHVPSTARVTIAKIILSKYLPNWKSLWATNVASYDPIHNYNMYEERDLTTTEDEEVVTDGTLARTGTETLQKGTVESIAHGRTNEEMTYRYGINTDTENPKPSDKVDTTEGGQTVTTNSGSDVDTRNLTDKNDVTETTDNDGTEHEEIHRYGNIGVTTTQKLIQEERQLWLWNYFDQIFADLDRELALAFHDPCRV